MRRRLADQERVDRWRAAIGAALAAAMDTQRQLLTARLAANGLTWRSPASTAPPGLWDAPAWVDAVEQTIKPVAVAVAREAQAVMRAQIPDRYLTGLRDSTDQLAGIIVGRALDGGKRVQDALSASGTAALIAAGGNIASIRDSLDFAAEQLERMEVGRAAQAVANAAQTDILATVNDATPELIIQVWNTEGDDRVRPSHEDMEGQERPIGEPFETGDGYLLLYPGDPSGPEEEIENCRCFLDTEAPVFTEGNYGPGGDSSAIEAALDDAVDAL